MPCGECIELNKDCSCAENHLIELQDVAVEIYKWLKRNDGPKDLIHEFKQVLFRIYKRYGWRYE